MSVDLPTVSGTGLAEVALSVGFEEFHRMLRYELDALWEKNYSRSFPNDEEKAPHKPFIEQLDGELSPLPSAAALTNIRRWFSSASGHHLIQVQRNWFARNWRATGPGVANGSPPAYPGYAQVRANFLDSLQRFVDFTGDSELGEFHPLQCEITYRLQLGAGDVWRHSGELDRAARLFSDRRGQYLPDLEAMRIITQFRMADSRGVHRGRLYGRLETARSGEAVDFLILTMFARGIPDGQTPESVCEFFDTAQPWIVNGIRDFLTPEAVAWYKLA